MSGVRTLRNCACAVGPAWAGSEPTRLLTPTPVGLHTHCLFRQLTRPLIRTQMPALDMRPAGPAPPPLLLNSSAMFSLKASQSTAQLRSIWMYDGGCMPWRLRHAG